MRYIPHKRGNVSRWVREAAGNDDVEGIDAADDHDVIGLRANSSFDQPFAPRRIMRMRLGKQLLSDAIVRDFVFKVSL